MVEVVLRLTRARTALLRGVMLWIQEHQVVLRLTRARSEALRRLSAGVAVRDVMLWIQDHYWIQKRRGIARTRKEGR